MLSLLLFLVPGLLLFPTMPQDTPPATSSLAEQWRKKLPEMQAAIEAYLAEARQRSGTVDVYNTTEEKKLLRSNTFKADGRNLLFQYSDSNKRVTDLNLFRTFDDYLQYLDLRRNNRPGGGILSIHAEEYREKEKPPFEIETCKFLLARVPGCVAYRPAPGVAIHMMELFRHPGLEVTSLTEETMDNTPVLKIVYKVHEEANNRVEPPQRLNNLIGGWVAVRPQHHYTLLASEFRLPGGRRQPPRLWQARYLYDTTTQPFQFLKAVEQETVDQASNPELKLARERYEFTWLDPQTSLTEKDFSLTQYEVKERLPKDWLADEAEKARAEAEEKAKIAALPPEALKPASQPLVVSPWAVLYGGVGAFILLVLWIFWVTSKPTRRDTLPPAGSSNPPPG